ATARLRNEKPGQTLQATALVHESYLRLVDQKHQQSWESRKHFFAAASEAMRRVLIENARRKNSQKRGGEFERADLELNHVAGSSNPIDLLELDSALDALEASDPQAALLVKLKFFSNLTMAECAEALETSTRSAERLWTFARTWLYQHMSKE
ncbi:MAG: ECF-type sigma factor, partial [Planctomycetota bacterium]